MTASIRYLSQAGIHTEAKWNAKCIPDRYIRLGFPLMLKHDIPACTCQPGRHMSECAELALYGQLQPVTP